MAAEDDHCEKNDNHSVIESHVINLLTLRLRKINCGKGLSTHGTLFVRGTGTITIGENVSITSCRETNPIGGDVKTILFAKNNATPTIR